MSRATSKTDKPTGSKFTAMLTGIVLGILLGLLMAGGVAWYVLTKNPRAFVSEEPSPRIKSVEEQKPSVSTDKKNGSEKQKIETEGKPQFDFYKVLTESKQESSGAPTQTVMPSTPVALMQLQAGAFQQQGDAEKLKAKLALLGIESTIQSASVPDRGLWYRVRLGPFANANEMNKMAATLKQNGLSGTPVRTQ